jgi:hypothetical protein
MTTKTCEHCGQPFTPARSDARTCSIRCRVAAHRLAVSQSAAEPPGVLTDHERDICAQINSLHHSAQEETKKMVAALMKLGALLKQVKAAFTPDEFKAYLAELTISIERAELAMRVADDPPNSDDERLGLARLMADTGTHP